MTTAHLFRRLSHKPVRHTCGHFEVRLMSQPMDDVLGYAAAESPCSQCAPQGRPEQPNYPTLEAALRAAQTA